MNLKVVDSSCVNIYLVFDLLLTTLFYPLDLSEGILNFDNRKDDVHKRNVLKCYKFDYYYSMTAKGYNYPKLNLNSGLDAF